MGETTGGRTGGERPAEQGVPVDRAFVCDDCGARWYYDRHRCPDCSGRTIGTYELGEGVLVARTTVEMTPPDVRSPNHLGIARFGKVRLTAQLVDGDVAVGDRVAFAGAHRLREGGDATDPRLTAIADEE
ncbi:Zn-ribbon domain-containing OB-fold protein [Halorubrum sp. CSM-61]|uniref:Zn-ribbon domain-containing OB-fold protein n=1 Tax=Halorubrum sp. CSM-61 TaxID=2485838 RepID=UPI000F4B0465|nr:hypothetical protein [Halorubrum sp. CSM-61]